MDSNDLERLQKEKKQAIKRIEKHASKRILDWTKQIKNKNMEFEFKTEEHIKTKIYETN